MRTRRLLDGALGAIGVAFGAPSLAWPFGWDTSVHYYVGREWLLRGAVPYRDTFDHKTPGIHLIHAVCVWLFGERMVGIRLVELACTVAIGWACGAIACVRSRHPYPGLRGACVLAASVLYYGFFDYWNTAQCELVGSTLAILTLLAAVRGRTLGQASAVAGALTGAQLLLKPPFVLFAAIAVVLLVRRASREAPRSRGRAVVRAIASFSLGAAAVVLPVAAYFGAAGAWPAMTEILVGANLVYLRDEPRVRSAAELLTELSNAWHFFAPVSTLVVGSAAVATVAAVVRRSRERLRRWTLAASACAASLVVVVAQLKLYHYHWSFAVSSITLVVACVMVDLRDAAFAPRALAVAPLASAALVAAFALTGVQFDDWCRTSSATVAWAMGRSSRARFASTFRTWDGLRQYGELEAAGLWVRDHSSPDDLVLARGIDAEIYVVSGRRAPGRFFWTGFLTRPSRRFHRERWLAEDRLTIDERRPRWVVALGFEAGGPDSPAWFQQLGYVERRRFGSHVVMERGDPAERPAAGRPVQAPPEPGEQLGGRAQER